MRWGCSHNELATHSELGGRKEEVECEGQREPTATRVRKGGDHIQLESSPGPDLCQAEMVMGKAFQAEW